MFTWRSLLIGLTFAALVWTTGCCCTGGLDDDDINQNFPHDQGGTHDEGYAY